MNLFRSFPLLLALLTGVLRLDAEDIPMAAAGSARFYITATKYRVAFRIPKAAEPLHELLAKGEPYVPAFSALVGIDGPRFAITLNADGGSEQTNSEYWDGEIHYVHDIPNRSLTVTIGDEDVRPFARYILRTFDPGRSIFAVIRGNYGKDVSFAARETDGKWIYKGNKDDGYGIIATLCKLADGSFFLESYLLTMEGGSVYSALINEYASLPLSAEECLGKLKTVYRMDIGSKDSYECLKIDFKLIHQRKGGDGARFRPGPLGEISVWDRRVSPSLTYKALDAELPFEKVVQMAQARKTEKVDKADEAAP